MARPRKTLRIKENGGSIQVFDELGYAGSISIRDLCIMLRSGLGTKKVYKETVVSEVKVQNEFG